MPHFRSAARSGAFHVVFLTLFTAISFWHTTPFPMDDHFFSQAFIEALAKGKIDFSILGFHGASFLSLPFYLITRSELTNIHFQVFCGLLLVPAAYLAAKNVFKDKFAAVVFSYAMALSPVFSYIAFRGFTFPSFTLFLLLSIWLYARGSRFAWLFLGISFLIKPFSIALAPLFLFWKPDNSSEKIFNRGWFQLALALLFPLVYITAEYAQIGRIVVGVHENLDQYNVLYFGGCP